MDIFYDPKIHWRFAEPKFCHHGHLLDPKFKLELCSTRLGLWTFHRQQFLISNFASNNCQLTSQEEVFSWVFSDQVKSIVKSGVEEKFFHQSAFLLKSLACILLLTIAHKVVSLYAPSSFDILKNH